MLSGEEYIEWLKYRLDALGPTEAEKAFLDAMAEVYPKWRNLPCSGHGRLIFTNWFWCLGFERTQRAKELAENQWVETVITEGRTRIIRAVGAIIEERRVGSGAHA